MIKKASAVWKGGIKDGGGTISTETGVLKAYTDGTTIVTDVNIEGAGRENLLNAVNATVGLSPVSVSFGAIPSGAGQTKSVAISLTNLSATSATWSLGIADTTGSGVSYSLSASSVTVAAGASATVNVRLTATKGASGGDHQAWLTVSSGGTLVAHAAVYTIVK